MGGWIHILAGWMDERQPYSPPYSRFTLKLENWAKHSSCTHPPPALPNQLSVRCTSGRGIPVLPVPHWLVCIICFISDPHPWYNLWPQTTAFLVFPLKVALPCLPFLLHFSLQKTACTRALSIQRGSVLNCLLLQCYASQRCTSNCQLSCPCQPEHVK